MSPWHRFLPVNLVHHPRQTHMAHLAIPTNPTTWQVNPCTVHLHNPTSLRTDTRRHLAMRPRIRTALSPSTTKAMRRYTNPSRIPHLVRCTHSSRAHSIAPATQREIRRACTHPAVKIEGTRTISTRHPVLATRFHDRLVCQREKAIVALRCPKCSSGCLRSNVRCKIGY